MKIVKKKPTNGKLIQEIAFDYAHMLSISEISEDQAEGMIQGKIITLWDDSFFNNENYKVYLTYPFDVIVEVELKKVNTIASMLWKISQAYKMIYEKEEKTSTIKTEERGILLNRNATNGNYGIWGHDMGDLVFETIQFYDNNIIELGLGS